MIWSNAARTWLTNPISSNKSIARVDNIRCNIQRESCRRSPMPGLRRVGWSSKFAEELPLTRKVVHLQAALLTLHTSSCNSLQTNPQGSFAHLSTSSKLADPRADSSMCHVKRQRRHSRALQPSSRDCSVTVPISLLRSPCPFYIVAI